MAQRGACGGVMMLRVAIVIKDRSCLLEVALVDGIARIEAADVNLRRGHRIVNQKVHTVHGPQVVLLSGVRIDRRRAKKN